MKVAISLVFTMCLIAAPASNPYDSLTSAEINLLKPQVERWIRDQVKHDWSDLWAIQDQTPQLKNEILLGHRDAPDLDRKQYVQAMRETIGVGYPEIKAFALHEVRREGGVFLATGCAKQQREAWKQTSIASVRIRVVDGKALFGLHQGTPEPCD